IELYDKHHKLVDFTESSSAQKNTITLQDFFYWSIKPCGTGIFHKRKIKKTIRWDPKIKSFQDWDFILQLGTQYSKGFLHIPYVLFEYLQKYGGDAICSNMSYKDWELDFEYMYQKHKNDPLLKGQKWYPSK